MRLNGERPGGLTKRQMIEAVHRAGLPKSRAFLPANVPSEIVLTSDPVKIQWVDQVDGRITHPEFAVPPARVTISGVER